MSNKFLSKNSLNSALFSFNKMSNSLATNFASINKITDIRERVFGSEFTDFTEQISSVKLLPFNVNFTDEETVPIQTDKGSFDDVRVVRIDKHLYMTLGQHFVEPKYNSFLDFNGYTSISAYLPWYGYVDIDTNECMGKYLQFRIIIDVNTGMGTHIIGVSDSPINVTNIKGYIPDVFAEKDFRVIATYDCKVSVDFPFGESSANEMKRNLLLYGAQAIAGFALSAATGSIPVGISATYSTSHTLKEGRSKAKGSRMKVLEDTSEMGEKITKHYRDTTRQDISQAIDAGLDALALSTRGAHSQPTSVGITALTMTHKVIVVYKRPIVAENWKNYSIDYNNSDIYAHQFGFPCGSILSTYDLKGGGFTKFSNVHFDTSTYSSSLPVEVKYQHYRITEPEVEMIEDLLEQGVYM